jgi:hypothetical protein
MKGKTYRYRSYYYDKDFALYYLNSYNLYAYCSNNPVMHVDPSGHGIDTVIDIIFLWKGMRDFIDDPSWEKAAFLALDIAFANEAYFMSIYGGPQSMNELTKLHNKQPWVSTSF